LYLKIWEVELLLLTKLPLFYGDASWPSVKQRELVFHPHS